MSSLTKLVLLLVLATCSCTASPLGAAAGDLNKIGQVIGGQIGDGGGLTNGLAGGSGGGGARGAQTNGQPAAVPVVVPAAPTFKRCEHGSGCGAATGGDDRKNDESNENHMHVSDKFRSGGSRGMCGAAGRGVGVVVMKPKGAKEEVKAKDGGGGSRGGCRSEKKVGKKGKRYLGAGAIRGWDGTGGDGWHSPMLGGRYRGSGGDGWHRD